MDDKLNQFNPNRLDGRYGSQKETADSLRGKVSPEELKELKKLGLDFSNVRFANKEGIEPVRTIREEILETAKSAVTQDRNTDYGTPEDNFKTIAAYWTIYLQSVGFNMSTSAKNRLHNHGLNSTDVAAMLSLMKHSRLATSPNKTDNWVDIAGYAACGAECASKRQGVSE